MADAKESVVQKKEKFVYADPFLRYEKPAEQPTIDARTIFRTSGLEVDKETLSAHPVYEEIDLVAEIQACKDLAGMDYMKRLLLTGQAKPSDFYDDGKSGLDTTLVPKTPHEAAKLAQENSEELGNLCKALGIEDPEGVTEKHLEEILRSKVTEMWNKQQEELAKKNEGGDK